MSIVSELYECEFEKKDAKIKRLKKKLKQANELIDTLLKEVKDTKKLLNTYRQKHISVDRKKK